MPQIIMLRPHHWVRSMSLWYRVLSVTSWSYHCANGWLPAHSSSIPSGFDSSRTAAIASAMSSTAAATVSPIPLVTSTVLVSSSPVTV